MPTSTPLLILASSSQYRREMLMRLRIPFEVRVPAVDETPLAGELPEQTALRLSAAKARAVATQLPAGTAALIIGADQVATLGTAQIGKPGNHAKALAQLQAMRGNTVIFHSALCLLDTRSDTLQSQDVRTHVRFRNLPDTELEAYLHAEQPYDCAGSAKSEGLGIALLESVQADDPTALVGLPLVALTTMLRQAGYPFFTAA